MATKKNYPKNLYIVFHDKENGSEWYEVCTDNLDFAKVGESVKVAVYEFQRMETLTVTVNIQ